MNESMFVAIDDQSAALTAGGTGLPIFCLPFFCWPIYTPGVNDGSANATANASGKNTTGITTSNVNVVQDKSSYSNSYSYAKAF